MYRLISDFINKNVNKMLILYEIHITINSDTISVSVVLPRGHRQEQPLCNNFQIFWFYIVSEIHTNCTKTIIPDAKNPHHLNFESIAIYFDRSQYITTTTFIINKIVAVCHVRNLL